MAARTIPRTVSRISGSAFLAEALQPHVPCKDVVELETLQEVSSREMKSNEPNSDVVIMYTRNPLLALASRVANGFDE